jgi:hypothetical protein
MPTGPDPPAALLRCHQCGKSIVCTFAEVSHYVHNGWPESRQVGHLVHLRWGDNQPTGAGQEVSSGETGGQVKGNRRPGDVQSVIGERAGKNGLSGAVRFRTPVGRPG